MNSQPSTFEAQYVSRTVGPAISKALAEIIQRRPVDPVEYLANFLHKHVENRRQQQLDDENEILVEKLRKEKEIQDQLQEEMKREAEALRIYEEELRKEKEAEERRKKELEELAKRKEEVANLAPALPSVVEEEESQLVEFGETKLHQLAAVAGSNLTHLLKENYNLAARNAQFKTARDIAAELNLDDNVRQIDEYIWDLVAQEKYKQLVDLVVLGYEDLLSIIESKYGNSAQMIALGYVNQAEQVYTHLPNVQAKIKQLKICIEKNDLETLKENFDKKWIQFRDLQGKSALHVAIEKGFFEIASFLVEKCPILSKMNDCAEKYPVFYLKQIDQAALDENDLVLHEQLLQYLSAD